MANDRKAVEGAIDYAVAQGGAQPASRIGAAGYIQGILYDWLNGRINSGSSLGARGWLLNKMISEGGGAGFILPLNDSGDGAVNVAPFVGTGSATFTRATTATTVNSAGLIVSVGSGVARSYYDPTTLEYRGYLPERARTNICLQSEDFSTTWSNSGSTDAVNVAVAPDGAMTADKLIPDVATANGRFVQSGLTITAGGSATFSVFAKSDGMNILQLQITNALGDSALVNFNTDTGVAGTPTNVGNWTGATAHVKQYPNGWWRLSVSVNIVTNAGDRVFLNHPNPDGDGTAGILVWGAQLELNSHPSSYIPTTTTAVTRNADVLSYPSAGNASGTAGTLYAEGFSVDAALEANGYLLVAGDGGPSERICLMRATTDNALLFIVVGGVQEGSVALGAWGNAEAGKIAGVYALNDARGSFNGGTSTTDTSVTIPTITTIDIGHMNGGSQFMAPIKNIRIWQTQFTADQLQAITA